MLTLPGVPPTPSPSDLPDAPPFTRIVIEQVVDAYPFRSGKAPACRYRVEEHGAVFEVVTSQEAGDRAVVGWAARCVAGIPVANRDVIHEVVFDPGHDPDSDEIYKFLPQRPPTLALASYGNRGQIWVYRYNQRTETRYSFVRGYCFQFALWAHEVGHCVAAQQLRVRDVPGAWIEAMLLDHGLATPYAHAAFDDSGQLSEDFAEAYAQYACALIPSTLALPTLQLPLWPPTPGAYQARYPHRSRLLDAYMGLSPDLDP